MSASWQRYSAPDGEAQDERCLGGAASSYDCVCLVGNREIRIDRSAVIAVPNASSLERATVPNHSAELSPALRVAPKGLGAPGPPGCPVRPVESCADEEDKPEALGDSAHADGATRDTLNAKGFTVTAKCPPVRNATGLVTKDRFDVDVATHSVTCPAGQRVTVNLTKDGGGRASFKVHCKECPIRKACTKSRAGRSISVHSHETILQRARAEQKEPGWTERYRADRPVVERKEELLVEAAA